MFAICISPLDCPTEQRPGDVLRATYLPLGCVNGHTVTGSVDAVHQSLACSCYLTSLLSWELCCQGQVCLTGLLVCVAMLSEDGGVQASHVGAAHPCR